MNWLQSYNEDPAGKRRPYNTEELSLIWCFFSAPQSLIKSELRVKCEKMPINDRDSSMTSIQDDDRVCLNIKKVTIIPFTSLVSILCPITRS